MVDSPGSPHRSRHLFGAALALVWALSGCSGDTSQQSDPGEVTKLAAVSDFPALADTYVAEVVWTSGYLSTPSKNPDIAYQVGETRVLTIANDGTFSSWDANDTLTTSGTNFILPSYVRTVFAGDEMDGWDMTEHWIVQPGSPWKLILVGSATDGTQVRTGTMTAILHHQPTVSQVDSYRVGVVRSSDPAGHPIGTFFTDSDLDATGTLSENRSAGTFRLFSVSLARDIAQPDVLVGGTAMSQLGSTIGYLIFRIDTGHPLETNGSISGIPGAVSFPGTATEIDFAGPTPVDITTTTTFDIVVSNLNTFAQGPWITTQSYFIADTAAAVQNSSPGDNLYASFGSFPLKLTYALDGQGLFVYGKESQGLVSTPAPIVFDPARRRLLFAASAAVANGNSFTGVETYALHLNSAAATIQSLDLTGTATATDNGHGIGHVTTITFRQSSTP